MNLLRYWPVICALLVSLPASAAIEEHSFQNDEQKERYQTLVDEMRCPKCLNANLSGSDAPIAADLRAEIYSQISSGKSDEEIIDFMTARYGDFILYRPPLNPGTALLWFGPAALLLAGFFIVRRMLKAAGNTESSETLSLEEQQKLDALLSVNGDRSK